MKAIILLGIITLTGCCSWDQYRREKAQERAVLDAWDKAGRP